MAPAGFHPNDPQEVFQLGVGPEEGPRGVQGGAGRWQGQEQSFADRFWECIPLGATKLTKKFLSTVLMACVASTVLVFGGTDPVFFSVVQAAVFLLFAWILWAGRAELSDFPWKGPLLLVGYIVVQYLSLNPDAYIIREQLVRLMTYLCVFYFGIWASHRIESQRRVVLGLIGLGLVETLYGLIQYLAGWHQILGYQKIFYTDRASGTYINPNHFAGFLEMVLPLALGYSIYRLTARIRQPTNAENISPAFLSFFASLVIFLGILFSRSRMGIFSAVLSLIGMGLLWLGTSRRRGVVLVGTVSFFLIAILLGLWVGIQPVVERYERTEQDVLARLAIWKDSVALIQAHPLFGTGLGTFSTVYTHAQSHLLTHYIDHAHNDYLESTVELGVLGAGLLFGLLGTVVFKGVKAFFQTESRWERCLLWGGCGSIIALLLHSLADFNFHIPANALVFALILGLLYGSALRIASVR